MCPPSCYPPPPPSLPHQSIQNVFHIITVVSCFTSVFFFVIFFYIVVKPFSNQNTSTRSSAPTNSTTHDDHVQRDVGSLGLEESVINSITICKYKRGGGLFEGNECPICPNEFCEDENLRLLPNCMHAFHLPCIDTWLKSNANCPLCRMNVNSNPMSSQWTNLSSSSPSSSSSSSSSSGSSEEPQDCIGLEIRGSNGGVGGIHSYTYVDIAALEDSSSAHVNCGYGSKSELGAVNLENDGIQLVRIVVSMDSSPASVISKETPQLTELVQSQALLDTEHEKNNG